MSWDDESDHFRQIRSLKKQQPNLLKGLAVAGFQWFLEFLFVVPGGGIEPPLPFKNWILSPARLPIPPSRHGRTRIIHETHAGIKLQCAPFYFQSILRLCERMILILLCPKN